MKNWWQQTLWHIISFTLQNLFHHIYFIVYANFIFEKRKNDAPCQRLLFHFIKTKIRKWKIHRETKNWSVKKKVCYFHNSFWVAIYDIWPRIARDILYSARKRLKLDTKRSKIGKEKENKIKIGFYYIWIFFSLSRCFLLISFSILV